MEISATILGCSESGCNADTICTQVIAVKFVHLMYYATYNTTINVVKGLSASFRRHCGFFSGKQMLVTQMKNIT